MYDLTFTAEKARELQNNHPDRFENVAKILKMIEVHVSNHKETEDYIFYYDYLNNIEIDKIIQLGYLVKDQTSQRDGLCYKISW